MQELPSGTVTFLFTDIEGSTKLWEQYPEAMQLALARHDALLRHVIEAQNGRVFKTVGDQFCAAFATAPEALAASVAAQQALLDFGLRSHPQISQIDADQEDTLSIHLRQSAKSADDFGSEI